MSLPRTKLANHCHKNMKSGQTSHLVLYFSEKVAFTCHFTPLMLCIVVFLSKKFRYARILLMVCSYTILLPLLSTPLAGLALTYALQTLNITQHGVRLASEVENLMTSVERVMSYTKLDPEVGYNTETRPPVSWPNEGTLTIKDLSLVYFKGGPRVLRNINVHVSSKEKVGVVGRTGAGKSSLVSALFRMPDPLGKVNESLLNAGFFFNSWNKMKEYSLEQGIKENQRAE